MLTRIVCLHKYQPIDFARVSSTLVVQCACQYSCVVLVLYSVLARIALDKAETSKETFLKASKIRAKIKARCKRAVYYVA